MPNEDRDIEDALRFLNELPGAKDSPFRTPPDYWQGMEARAVQEGFNKPARRGWVQRLRDWLPAPRGYAWGAAALGALVLFCVLWLSRLQTPMSETKPPNSQALALQINQEDWWNYVQEEDEGEALVELLEDQAADEELLEWLLPETETTDTLIPTKATKQDSSLSTRPLTSTAAQDPLQGVSLEELLEFLEEEGILDDFEH